MKKFIKNIAVFFLIAIVVGEIVIRVFHVVIDLPQRTIGEFGIQKYYPNQSGYWKDGTHKWKINKHGWPGDLPDKYDNLITVIGDSFIENFMNPNECHQSKLLNKRMDEFNFIEAGRSGVSFIESMEISKQLDSLKPIYHLIYVSNQDFTESVSNIKTLEDITQLDVETNSIIYGKMKAPGLKKILYNWKLLYYFYNRFPLNFSITKDSPKKVKQFKNTFKDEEEIFLLINYTQINYNITNKILVFHPKSDDKIIEICQKAGFKTIILNSDYDKSWTFEHDHHWTCYGNDRVAEQVSKALISKFVNNKDISNDI